jgi:hypothetical protein
MGLVLKRTQAIKQAVTLPCDKCSTMEDIGSFLNVTAWETERLGSSESHQESIE